MHDPDLIVTIRRASEPDAPPLLITGGPHVIRAVIRALAETLGVTDTRVLKLQRALEPDHGATP